MGEDFAQLRLVQSIEKNTKHYVEILSKAVDTLLPEPGADVTYAHFPPVDPLPGADYVY